MKVWRKPIAAVGAVVGLSAAALAIAWGAGTFGGAVALVPDLTGMKPSIAKTLLAAEGLHVRVRRVPCCAGAERTHPSFGTIWSQMPEANQSLEQGGTVTVVVPFLDTSLQ
jgi:beta-lactam-binding protein with PASTA domain